MYKFFVKSNQIKDMNDNINNERKADKSDKIEKANGEGNNLIATITGEDVNHISNVLRLAVGEDIIICNNDTGQSYNATIASICKEYVECKIRQEVLDTTECPVDIDLFQGLPKSDKMEYIIQKTTELGVKTIYPVEMERCIVKLDSKSASKKLERWNKIAEAAAKQSKRDIIPEVKNIINIENICKNTEKYDIILIAYENEEKTTLKTELQKLKDNKFKEYSTDIKGEANVKSSDTVKLKIGVVIGPEGGLSEREVTKLMEAGAKSVSLGKRILRTETAPIVMISDIIYEFED